MNIKIMAGIPSENSINAFSCQKQSGYCLFRILPIETLVPTMAKYPMFF